MRSEIGKLFPACCYVGALAQHVADELLDDSVAFHAGLLWEMIDGALNPLTYFKALAETIECDPEVTENYGAMFSAILNGKRLRRTADEYEQERRSLAGEDV